MTSLSITALVEQCAEEMVGSWAAGEVVLAEVYLSLHPELYQHPDAVLELLAEELALREEHRRPIAPAELEARFPQWQLQVRALLECQQLLGGYVTPPEFPQPGEHLGEFLLKAELGRGAHGRVYLAAQTLLANRPVVLKVSRNSGTEHLSLARLQHTNIVPLYSAMDFPERRLRALCLPYFGGLTLAEIQSQLVNRATSDLAGRDILEVVRAATASEPDTTPQRGAAWNELEQATLLDAVCWIGANLADALQYAHNRGILHLDLKPSNVLIAADGVPMLLDFHLAHSPIAAGDVPPNWLGGTPHGMSPEHLAAVDAVRSGQRIQAAVDARADVFSFGLMLQEFLDATHCAVSPGVADILRKCTQGNPAKRYAQASEVAEDFRRHLAHRPLKGVANRSPWERWRKWRRRKPYALPLSVAAVALLIGVAGLTVHFSQLSHRAQVSLDEARGHFEQGRYTQANELLRGGESLLAGVPFQARLRGQIHQEREAVECAMAADELHLFAEKLRFIAVAQVLQTEELRKVAAECRVIWDHRVDLAKRLSQQPTSEPTDRWKTDLLEVGLQVASLTVRIAPPPHTDAKLLALQTLDEAVAVLGPSAIIEQERLRYGQLREANAPRILSTRPKTAWDHVDLGRTHLATGDNSLAAEEFAAARRLEPQTLWGHYYHGITLLKLQQPDDAVAAFSACIALNPSGAWCWYNRGLAYQHLDRHADAALDFDRAIDLDPTLWAAYFERSAALLKAGQTTMALDDLQHAANAGAPRGEAEYRMAVVCLAANNRPQAEIHLNRSLTIDPGHFAAKKLFSQLAER